MPGVATWPTGSGSGAGWPTATGDAGSDGVKVRRLVKGRGSIGERASTYGAWSPTTYGAKVAPKTGTEVDRFGSENPVARYEVTLPFRLDNRDQVLWIEVDMTLTVLAVVAAGTSAQRTWLHVCEEHI